MNDLILTISATSSPLKIENLGIRLPGLTGDTGETGNTGADGAAATIEVGTVTTGGPGTEAIITNSGTTSAAVLNFTIPKGADGLNGSDGTDGATGAPGADGKSAYEQAVEGGYAGTEAEFNGDLADLPNKAEIGHTHNYAGSSTPGGAADNAIADSDGNNIVDTYATKIDTQLLAKNEVINGDFRNGTTGWSASIATLTIVSSKLRIYYSNTSGSIRYPAPNQTISGINGHKYYVSFNISEYVGNNSISFVQFGTQVGINTFNSNGRCTAVFTADNNATSLFFNNSCENNTIVDYYINNVMLIDLTATFGVGNEPTAIEMDSILSYYPNSWFDGTVNLANNTKLLPYLLASIRAKASITQEAWITPTLTNGWTLQNDGYYNAQYMIDSLGFVHLRGLITGGANDSVCFSLPEGYRPSRLINYVTQSNNNYATVFVYASGSVVVHSYTTFASLENAIFFAER